MSAETHIVEATNLRTKIRNALLHLGFVTGCAAYILAGAALFFIIERPNELEKRKKALEQFELLQENLVNRLMTTDEDVETQIDQYVENIFKIFDDPFHAHVFETHYTNYSTLKDLWTFESAALFTTTTVFPVGYGYVCPATALGRLLVVIYGICGIPLALITITDTGKFLNHVVSEIVGRFFTKSEAVLMILFLLLLSLYIVLGGVFFHYKADISHLDAIYFSFTSVFTIGFGDIEPNVNAIHLVWFVTMGIMLVTITIDSVVAELINNMHYMGRGVGKAKQIAGKMLEMATSLNMNRGIHGLAVGMNQLQALAKLGLLGRLDKEALESGERVTAFAPALDDVDFMDMGSVYASRTDVSRDDGRHLFL